LALTLEVRDFCIILLLHCIEEFYVHDVSTLLCLPTELRFIKYDFAMETFSGKYLHDDYLDWDRLSLSRASRQLFAETAHDYLDHKLYPGQCLEVLVDDIASLKDIVAERTPSQ
jgi:hypothetical protein